MVVNRTAPGRSGLVLAVDDDKDMRTLLQDCLSAEGISCITAASVEEAILALKNNQVTLTLLDWGLRGALDASGSEVLRFCKEQFPSMPVLVMSGQTMDVRTDAVVKRADGFLQKPFGGTVVTSQISEWLRRIDATPRTFLPRREEDILSLDQFKRLYIRHVVQLLGGNISLAAARLKIHRHTIAAALKDDSAADSEKPGA
jgi:DNA-binding response OmpR family regulator